MDALLIFLKNIHGMFIRRHHGLVAVATVAGDGQIQRIYRALGIRDGGDVVVTVAIRADGAALVAALKEQFPVGAGLVARQLVRGQAVEIHRLDIRVAFTAFLGDLFFIGGPDKSRRGILGRLHILLRWVAAVATVAGDLVPGVDTSFHLFPLVGVADDTIIVLDVLGTDRGGQTNSQKQPEKEFYFIHQ